jgi:hypothetical protein
MKAMGMMFIAGAFVALLFWLTAKSWHSPRQLITVDGSSPVISAHRRSSHEGRIAPKQFEQL